MTVPSPNISQLKMASSQSSNGKNELRFLVEKYVNEALRKIKKVYKKDIRIDKIVLSGRLSATMGMAKFLGEKGLENTIVISSKIFSHDCNALKDTVFHEVAHIADWEIYRHWGHGDTWVSIMKNLGITKPNPYINPQDYIDAGYDIIKKRRLDPNSKIFNLSKIENLSNKTN